MKSKIFYKVFLLTLLFNLIIPAGFSGALACCSLRPAEFNNTKLYAGVTKKDNKTVHLLGYQNSVRNLAISKNVPMGNAMLLPIPAKQGTMTEENILDTSKCKTILSDMERAITPRRPMHRTRSFGVMKQGLAPAVQIFDHDIYTIVLAKDAKDIPAALKKVRADRRPQMNKEIFDAYAKWYPGWTFALCCFNTASKAKANPMLWWYEPLNPKQLFLPALDAHDGKPPKLDARVEVSHAVIVSSDQWTPEFVDKAKGLATKPKKVRYRHMNVTPETRKLFPDYVMGSKYRKLMPNGDFVVNLSDLNSSKLNIMRKQPPGA